MGFRYDPAGSGLSGKDPMVSKAKVGGLHTDSLFDSAQERCVQSYATILLLVSMWHCCLHPNSVKPVPFKDCFNCRDICRICLDTHDIFILAAASVDPTNFIPFGLPIHDARKPGASCQAWWAYRSFLMRCGLAVPWQLKMRLAEEVKMLRGIPYHE